MRLFLLAILPASIAAQRHETRCQRRKPQAERRRGNESERSHRRTTASGRSMENTTMLQGARERSEMKLGGGMDIINVAQCDLKRTIPNR